MHARTLKINCAGLCLVFRGSEYIHLMPSILSLLRSAVLGVLVWGDFVSPQTFPANVKLFGLRPSNNSADFLLNSSRVLGPAEFIARPAASAVTAFPSRAHSGTMNSAQAAPPQQPRPSPGPSVVLPSTHPAPQPYFYNYTGKPTQDPTPQISSPQSTPTASVSVPSSAFSAMLSPLVLATFGAAALISLAF